MTHDVFPLAVILNVVCHLNDKLDNHQCLLRSSRCFGTFAQSHSLSPELCALMPGPLFFFEVEQREIFTQENQRSVLTNLAATFLQKEKYQMIK